MIVSFHVLIYDGGEFRDVQEIATRHNGFYQGKIHRKGLLIPAGFVFATLDEAKRARQEIIDKGFGPGLKI